ncbi:acyltransferase family protein [Ligilactobacillus apodemi]|uniref:acyltransferase family protein n=1 Tax=Ligilactobacillus apodemi TaxID=307126 RepID=UPI00214B60EF|nr:acyltransferase [Ligilactobacillus apodemi]MCR1901918.1 acyltransferase [Ligilactobacillus apodemi]
MGKERNSNFELLRIVCMFFIVLHHFSIHGIATNGNFVAFKGSFGNLFVAELLASLGKPAVMIFVFISGFYLINSKFKLKRILNLLWKVFTYSVLILLLVWLLQIGNLSLKNIIVSFLPTSYGAYWFITDYVILSLFVPFINKFILSSDRRFFEMFILTLWLVSSLIPTFLAKSALSNNELLLFLLFYSVGAYIRLYITDRVELKKFAKYFTLIGSLALFGGIVVLNILSLISSRNIFSRSAMHLTTIDSTVALIFAIGVFLYFTSRPKFSSAIINVISASSLAVYIISDNPLLRGVIWQSIFHVNVNSQTMNPWMLLLYGLMSTTLIYIFCTIIDIIKLKVLDTWLNPIKLLNENTVDNLYKKFIVHK